MTDQTAGTCPRCKGTAIDPEHSEADGIDGPAYLEPCIDCTPAPVPADVREQIAAIFRSAPGQERLGDATPGEIADAVLRAPAIAEALETAAALERVQQLHQPMSRAGFLICAHCSGWNGRRCLGVIADYPCDTLAALGVEKPQPAEPPVHIGGRANAEDCPACENPPYPFICPGPAQPQEQK